MVATWVSRIPAIKGTLGLSDATLGLTLLGSAAGSACSIPITGWLIGRFGSRRVTLWSSIGFCATLAPVSFAFSARGLAGALFVFGALGGAMDVAINVQGVEAEKAIGRPIMSRLHGAFSLGAMLGGALGGLAASRALALRFHFTIAAVVLGCISVGFVGGEERQVSEPRAGLHLQRRLVLIGLIAFCILLSEGAMADWTAVYLHQTLLADAGTAALGYTVFSAAMATFRLLGDSITLRLGRVNTVRTGSLLATCGVLIAVIAPSVPWAIAGFGIAGAGLSVIVPLAFGAGGRTGVATITWLGYAGFLIGPPLIGFTSQATSLRHALGIVAAACLISALLAGQMNPHPGTTHLSK